MGRSTIVLLILPVVLVQACSRSQSSELPIIDIHNHAQSPSAWGPPPVMACAGEVTFPAPEPGALPSPDRTGRPQNGYNLESAGECDSAAMIQGGMTDEEVMQRTFEMMERYNIVTGVFTGSMDRP